MEFVIIGVVAFVASGLTLYSGFGLGTVLLPAFALFFPAPAAVAATGVVHLLNNLFKGGLVGREAHWPTVWRLGLPAIPGAIAGALLLSVMSGASAFHWQAFGRDFAPSAAGIVIGLAMIVFALFELMPWFQRLTAPPKLVPLGGALIGFLGGLTGHQGALRSMFLLKGGLDAAQYVATGTVVAVLVDLSRLPTYAASFAGNALSFSGRPGALIATGTLCAFAGAWLGARYMKKATIGIVRVLIVTFMLLIGAALITGVLGS